MNHDQRRELGYRRDAGFVDDTLKVREGDGRGKVGGCGRGGMFL